VTADELKSISGEAELEKINNPLLRALWYDYKGDWNKAHTIAQDISTREAARVHAYLHRKEGDEFNALYWYNRAGVMQYRGTLEDEWEDLVRLSESGFAGLYMPS